MHGEEIKTLLSSIVKRPLFMALDSSTIFEMASSGIDLKCFIQISKKDPDPTKTPGQLNSRRTGPCYPCSGKLIKVVVHVDRGGGQPRSSWWCMMIMVVVNHDHPGGA